MDFSSEPLPTSDGSEPLSTLSVFSTLLHARAARLSLALWLHGDVHITRRTHCTFLSSCSVRTLREKGSRQTTARPG